MFKIKLQCKIRGSVAAAVLPCGDLSEPPNLRSLRRIPHHQMMLVLESLLSMMPAKSGTSKVNTETLAKVTRAVCKPALSQLLSENAHL